MELKRSCWSCLAASPPPPASIRLGEGGDDDDAIIPLGGEEAPRGLNGDPTAFLAGDLTDALRFDGLSIHLDGAAAAVLAEAAAATAASCRFLRCRSCLRAAFECSSSRLL